MKTTCRFCAKEITIDCPCIDEQRCFECCFQDYCDDCDQIKETFCDKCKPSPIKMKCYCRGINMCTNCIKGGYICTNCLAEERKVNIILPALVETCAVLKDLHDTYILDHRGNRFHLPDTFRYTNQCIKCYQKYGYPLFDYLMTEYTYDEFRSTYHRCHKCTLDFYLRPKKYTKLWQQWQQEEIVSYLQWLPEEVVLDTLAIIPVPKRWWHPYTS